MKGIVRNTEALRTANGRCRAARAFREFELPAAALLASALLFAPTGAVAQGEADTFSVYRESDIHAACDSKDLPSRGFKILQVVPNTKGKDCYWKRVASPPASDLRSAIEAARARRDAALREVGAMRADGWTAFWRHFNSCGADMTCQSEIIRARIAIERDLDAQAARINQNFHNDMQSLLHAQVRRDTPVGGTPER